MFNQNAAYAENQRGKQRKVSAEHSSSPSPVAPDGRALESRRHERIQEYLAATLDSHNILQACMGPVICDLLEMLGGLRREITEVLALGPMELQQFENPIELERLENLRPNIELYARLANQVYKLANLERARTPRGPTR